MLYSEFAAAYPATMTPDQIHRGEHAPYMQEAQKYSYMWGIAMQAVLRNDSELASSIGQEWLSDYFQWSREGGIAETVARLDNAPPEARNHGINELNFHILNAHMEGFWMPFMAGGWKNDAERYAEIKWAQDTLALKTLDHVIDRQNIIEAAGGTEIFYDPANPDIVAEHGTMTGIIQEYEAAFILLEFMRKHKNTVVLPAPLQFERTRKRTNVDFVVADFVGQRAVGAQVKSRLRQEDVAAADPDRVVFIDGDTDLNNIKVVRIRKGRSTEAVKPWPGIVSTKHVNRMASHGKQSRVEKEFGPKLPIIKRVADRLTGGLKVDHQALVQTIGERILTKL